MPELLLISGSVRTNSTNSAALRALAVELAGATEYLGLAGLPHFNPDLDQPPLPAPVAGLRAAIAAADGLLFSTPEYAGALPGAFKNLLDWTIGGAEMSGKRVGWVNCSERGAAGAYAELATVLRYAGTVVVEAACAQIPVGRADLAGDAEITDQALRQRLAAVARALLTGAEG